MTDYPIEALDFDHVPNTNPFPAEVLCATSVTPQTGASPGEGSHVRVIWAGTELDIQGSDRLEQGLVSVYSTGCHLLCRTPMVAGHAVVPFNVPPGLYTVQVAGNGWTEVHRVATP